MSNPTRFDNSNQAGREEREGREREGGEEDRKIPLPLQRKNQLPEKPLSQFTRPEKCSESSRAFVLAKKAVKLEDARLQCTQSKVQQGSMQRVDNH